MQGYVSSVRRATLSTRIVRIKPDHPVKYRAGQGTELGPEDSRTISPYSIACAPDEAAANGSLEFLIKVDSHERWGEDYPPLRRGQRLRMRGPFGRFVFPDRPAEKRFLFIAGGTGIAPLRAMIRHARARIDGTYCLLYSARTPHDFAYRRELCGMARRGELHLTLTATRGAQEPWRGERGRITPAQLAPLIENPATLCFVCGPAAMVDEVPRMLRDLGIDRSRIHVEEW